MDKFIRTKDNKIYKVDSIVYIEGDTPYYCVEGVDDFAFEQLISEADTIDELCDLFYLDRGGDIDINEFYDKHQFDVAKENYLEEIRHSNPVELKAYINTDKGLIYVAEMDENGELVLL